MDGASAKSRIRPDVILAGNIGATKTRYITRPPIANEWLALNRAGQVVLTPDPIGHDHIVMSPLEFIQRLAALVPRPRLHLIRFHGVLAPNARARLRPDIIPNVPINANTPSADHAEVPPPAAPARLSRARLLTKPPGAVLNGAMDFRKRVFDIDTLPHGGSPLPKHSET